MKERLGYVDAIKGIAIFLMVMGHVLAWCHADAYAVKDGGPFSALFWWRVIYAFHMPLFFCVSGYLYCKPQMTLNEGVKLLWKRVRNLLMPFLAVGCIFYFTTGGDFTKYWFLRMLFVVTFINICYDFFRTKFKLGKVSDILFYTLSFAALFMAGKMLKGTILDTIVDIGHFSSFHYMGFCIGICIRRYDRFRALLENNWTYSVCLGLFVLLLFQFPIHKSVRSFVMCVSGIVCVWYLMSYVFVDGSVIRLLQRFGRHSLDIYLVHFFLCINVTEIGEYFVYLASRDTYFPIFSGCMLQLLYGLVISLVICIVSLLIARIVNASKLWSGVLQGKIRS